MEAMPSNDESLPARDLPETFRRGCDVPPCPTDLRVERYGRFWAVWDGLTLVCVTVYLKGARSVVARLAALTKQLRFPQR